MKNKELEKLLKQENNAPDILTEIKTPKTFVKKEKTSFVSKFTLKQRVVALSVACSLLVIAIITPLLIIFLGGMENYDKLIIKNFEQYDKIGVGVETTSASGMGGLGFVSLGTTYASSGNKKYKLVGQKENGEIEQLILKDMKTDKQTTPKLFLSGLWSGENFTIVEYRKNSNYGYFRTDGDFALYEDTAFYLIDNNTGKFYSLNDFFRFKVGGDVMTGGETSGKEWSESNNTLIVLGVLKKDLSASNHTRQDSLFELKIVENELKLEKLISVKDYNFNDYVVDRYSNIYIGGTFKENGGGKTSMFDGNYYDNYTNGIKILPSAVLVANKDYQIETISENLVLSENKIVYTADGQYCYNENGEKVANDFADFNHFYFEDSLIQKNGNTEFYYVNKWDQEGQLYYCIDKLVWTSDTEFTVEEIKIDDYADKYVFTNDRIYFLKNEEVFSISIYDGSKESLVSDYLFNDIQTNNLGEVLFTAINKSDRQVVNGKINKDGEIEINFKKIKYDVLYIKPLN